MMNQITTLVELVQDGFAKTNHQINVGVLKLGHASLLSSPQSHPPLMIEVEWVNNMLKFHKFERG